MVLLTCHVCGKEYKNRFNFNYHVAHHSDARPFPCDFPGCLNAYKTKSDLRQHQKSHEKYLGISFTCYRCNLNFESSTQLNVHNRQQHHYRLDAAFKTQDGWCKLCNRHFDYLGSHIKSVHAVRLFTCDIDGKRFARMSGLVRHINAVHLALTPFECMLCTKKFTENSDLMRHMRAHSRMALRGINRSNPLNVPPLPNKWSDDEEIVTEIIKYKCGSCARSFTSRESLQKHTTKYHPNCAFCCDLCGQNFISKQKISAHIVNVHELKLTQEKVVIQRMYKCGLCKKILSRKAKLDQHKRYVHLNIYEFFCEQCPAAFKDRRNFTSHLIKVHKQKAIKQEQLKCAACGKAFRVQHLFEQHEIACRLKKQEMFNRELDKNFKAPQLKSEEIRKESTVETNPEILIPLIKQEPEECEMSDDDHFAMPDSPLDSDDAFPMTEVNIKQETIDPNAPASIFFPESDIKKELEIKEEPLDDVESDMPMDEIELDKPMKLVTKLSCKLCPEKFKTKEDFVQHFKMVHVEVSLMEFPPDVVVLSSVWLEKFKCKTCSEMFLSVDDVTEHNLVDHGKQLKNVETFRCAHCPRVFETNGQLKVHSRIHETESDQEKQETDGEPENIDEDELRRLFKGETFNTFSKVYECKLCSKEFKFSQDLKLHCVRDHRIKKFKCNGCNHSFGRIGKFRQHWTKKHKASESFHQRKYPIPNEDVKCSLCPSIFTHTSNIKAHMELVHDKGGNLCICDHCGKKCKHIRNLNYHILKLHSKVQSVVKPESKKIKQEPCSKCGESIKSGNEARGGHKWKCDFKIKILRKTRFLCLICEQVMKSPFTAKRHFMQVHDGGTKLARTCGACNMQFKLYEDFEWHVTNIHVGANICLVCGVSCRTTVDLFAHSKSHRRAMEIEKKYACDYCGFKAQQKVTLENHMTKLHGAAKAHYFATCEICGASFSAYISFYQHMKAHQTQKKEKIKCTYCDKTYSNVQYLRNHEKSHVNPETYHCKFPGCNRTYSNFMSYRWHANYAHSKIANQCKACNVVLSSHEKLLAHIEQVHPEMRQYRCSCGKSYSAEISFMKHRETCNAFRFD